tara:strand:+ start:256 stop:444 length:189 start_codon:yes stop_codon:yes gene_type:complete
MNKPDTNYLKDEPFAQQTIDRLEWHDGGDGIEYEEWIDPLTKEIWVVPIEIRRDFSYAYKED